jgi:2-keto-4-pentenoate hydratase/2-oxohepta-3-ene-1,7-dioic acid hydratase in catechol pathway
MRYVTFSERPDSPSRLGVILADRVVAIESFSSLLELIDAGSAGWDRAAAEAAHSGKTSYARQDVRLHAPIPILRRNVFCVGVNYISHMKEATAARGREQKVPEVPVFFTKATGTLNGPFDPVVSEKTAAEQIDYEAELAVVIGTGGKNIPRSRALDHVFGYMVINDVTARDVQLKHMQWFKGKSFDGFCPMGPWIVTSDEFGDPQNKNIRLRLNGETRQDSNTRDMIFSVAIIIEWLSLGLTLQPGDIIATGTPHGVGLGRTPPEYMNDGDVMEAEVEGIGMIRNRLEIRA